MIAIDQRNLNFEGQTPLDYVNLRPNKSIILTRLGTIPFQEAWDLQTNIFEKTVAYKILNRNLSDDDQIITTNHLLLCQHTPVYTLGKSGKPEHLLLDNQQLASVKAEYFHINRGGDITYHGPGQLVVYPILDMDNFFTDIHLYLRLLEEAVIKTLEHFNISSTRIAGLTGVWLKGTNGRADRKICAFGVKMSRWVTMHGLALNVNTDLKYFENIIPCGIVEKEVTSMEKELGTKVNLEEVENILIQQFADLLGADIIIK